MSVKAQEFLESAKGYLEKEDEVHLRNAASRAYYAFYHEVEPRLKNIPPPQGVGSHKNLCDYLKAVSPGAEDFTPRDLKIIGYQLNLCRTYRTDADYNLDMEFTKVKANDAVATSERAIQKVLSMIDGEQAESV